ncbi:MAG: hypothetical protein V4631_11510 [Pseudomonadota bacterium]
MKQTTLSSKCLSSARGLSRDAIVRGASSAHTPQRHWTCPARAMAAPCVNAAGHHPGYVEAPPAPEPASVKIAADDNKRTRVLHVDSDSAGALMLASLLKPEAQVVHVATLDEARRLLEVNVFSLVVLDPALPDGDARMLLPLLAGTPLLVYAAHQPEWRDTPVVFLPKPWTTSRQLWVTVATLLGVPGSLAAGD